MKSYQIYITSILFSISLSTHAALLTADTITGSTIVDFSTQATVTNDPGPLQVGTLIGEDITLTSPTGSLYANFNGWGLNPNGDWGSGGRTYVSVQDGTFTFAFNDGPVSAVGGFMSYGNPAAGMTITALDAGMAVLETYDIIALAPIIEPALNGGAFRGIERGVADIAFFQITGAVPVLDDLTFARGAIPAQAVPTMSVWGLMMLISLMGIFGFKRRMRS